MGSRSWRFLWRDKNLCWCERGNFSTICYPPKVRPQYRITMSTLIQSVIHCGQHSRMYYYVFFRKLSGKVYSQSIGPPIDWLCYYDSLSRIKRGLIEIYSFKLFSVAYLILPDRMQRESHYHNCTRSLTTEELIPSERLLLLSELFSSSWISVSPSWSVILLKVKPRTIST